MSKRCRLTCDTERGIYECELDVPDAATIATVLEAGRLRLSDALVDWDGATVGVFGQPHDRQFVPADGDRIEIYRGCWSIRAKAAARAPRATHRSAAKAELLVDAAAVRLGGLGAARAEGGKGRLGDVAVDARDQVIAEEYSHVAAGRALEALGS